MFCGKCGNIINDGEKFCGICGNQLIFSEQVQPVVSISETPDTQQSNTNNSVNKKVIAIASVAAAIIFDYCGLCCGSYSWE